MYSWTLSGRVLAAPTIPLLPVLVSRILLLTDNESDKHIFYALREVLRHSHYPPPPSNGVINDPRYPPLLKFTRECNAMKQQSNYYYGNSSKSDLQILLVLVMDLEVIVVL